MRSIPRPPLAAALVALLGAVTLAHPAAAQRRPIPPLWPRYDTPQPARPTTPAPVDSSGLRFRVSQGTGHGALQRPAPTAGRPLSAAEAQRVLNRLRPLPVAQTASDSFAFPAQTLPAPRTGRLLLAAFPPPDSAPPRRPDGGGPAALAVARRAPEGEVGTGAEVTVTFSQPMVPLTSVGTLAGAAVPVRITPQTPGRWRWIDVRTVKFEPQGRLPMATEFAVEIPAGTRAAGGAALGEAVRWSFATPAPNATGAWPQHQPVGLNPVLVVAFDQRVDPAAVLRSIHLRVNGTEIPVRLATAAEIRADAEAKARIAGVDSLRRVAFRAARPLPVDARVQVAVGPGTPSAEGPRRTAEAQEWEFRTYGRLRVRSSRCGWSRDQCRPGVPWHIELSTPLDTAFREAWVRVEPALPGMRVYPGGSQLTIHGRAAPNTRYTVRLDPALRDRFGQTLGPTPPLVFAVGAPVGEIAGPEGTVVLDPLGAKAVSVFSHDFRRLRVRVHQVTPADFPAFAEYVEERRLPTPDRLPGTPVVDRVVTVDAPAGEQRETRIDLAPALSASGLGHVVVAVTPVDADPEVRQRQSVYIWVQSTRLALAAYDDAEKLVAWASSLVDGSPAAGATVELAPRGLRATADADGLARMALPEPRPQGTRQFLVARLGEDAAILPETGPSGYATWVRRTVPPAALWYVVTDRHLYRPGETVRFKGWVRRLERGPGGGLELPHGWGDSVAFTVRDPRRNEIARGTARLTALGGFDAEFTVPEGANLGHAQIELVIGRRDSGVEGSVSHHPFQVQEFRRPEYTVSASVDPGPYVIGSSAEVTARAAYFAGGALPGADVEWSLESSPARFTPAGWDEWSFGLPGGWWWEDGDFGRGRSVQQSFSSVTDAGGVHSVRLDFDRAVPPRAFGVSAQATVYDVNRQTWTASATLLVHPAEVYVGLRPQRAWLERGDSLDLDVVVVDLDGKPVAGRPVEVSARRGRWGMREGRWQMEAETVAGSCAPVSAAQPVRCVFPAAEGGIYTVTAATTDAAGRATRTAVRVWVWEAGVSLPGPSLAEENEVEVIPDRARYEPGDTARLLLRLPFRPSRGIVTVQRGGIDRVLPFQAEGTTAVVAIPLGEDDVPGAQVTVSAAGAGDGRDESLARGVNSAAGTFSLTVSPARRALTVSPVPADSVAEPDGETAVEVEVRDAAGRPVAGAEVALAVVDEAVLALTGYRFPDPIQAFYPPRHPSVSEASLRRVVIVEAPELAPAPGTLVGRVVDARNGQAVGQAKVRLAGGAEVTADAHGHFRLTGVGRGTHTVEVARPGYLPARVPVTVGDAAHPPLRITLVPGGDEATMVAEYSGLVGRASGVAQDVAARMPPGPPPPPPAMQGLVALGEEAPIAIRTNFDPLALFVPALRTGADGRVRVPFRLPSNLTRYRIVAVAVEGARHFGLGESALTARQPLMVRPSAPRFLNWGDRFELPIVVQNQTGEAMEVDVAARASGVSLAEAGKRVTVPAHDRVEVRLAAEAVRAGPAVFQVAAVSAARADAAELALPVWTPATAEAFATYGSLTGDSAAVLPLQVPMDAIPAFGALEVTTSTTALQELTDALLYLVRYPYECAEQISSRLLSIAALRDVLTAFKAEEMPPPEVLRDFVERDVRSLAALQNADGGFGFWKRGDPSWPYVSIHAAHALQRAKDAGYAVPDEVMNRSRGYLRRVPANVTGTYPEDVRRALHAYALYTRARTGENVGGEVARFLAATETRRDTLTLEMAGWLLWAAKAGGQAEATASLLRVINNRTTETAQTATFATRYTEGEYLLLHSGRRSDGVVLEALVAAAPESPLIPKTVRGLLGHRVRGRWNDTQENAWILLALDAYFRRFEGQTPELAARVWLGERFAGGHQYSGRSTDRHQVAVPMRVLQEERPASVTIAEEGPGRLYYRAGLRYAPRDLDLVPLQAGFAVERTYAAVDDPGDVARGADGRWRVRAGARVRVTVTMTAPSRRVHVALVDPLPAGFEPVNAELQGAQGGSRTSGRSEDGGYGWWWRWYEHQNLRDDRAEAFSTLVHAGVHTFTYVARATTPGLFLVPPPRAEEMYSPETFGRGQTDRVIVEMREDAAK